jgi:hypothetical protein
MPFKKGERYAGSGRPKGGKKITDFKLVAKDIVEKHTKQLNMWLDRVGESDPDKAIKLLMELAEFNFSKLSRIDVVDSNKYPISFTFTPANKAVKSTDTKKVQDEKQVVLSEQSQSN